MVMNMVLENERVLIRFKEVSMFTLGDSVSYHSLLEVSDQNAHVQRSCTFGKKSQLRAPAIEDMRERIINIVHVQECTAGSWNTLQIYGYRDDLKRKAKGLPSAALTGS